MKKTLIALAALASTAAFAQSSVTLSGNISAAYERSEQAGVDGDAQITGYDGSGNRIIFSGTEDLGGGLKAGFHLQSRLDLSTGMEANAGSRLFEETFVSLSGGFGAVRVGRFQAFSNARFDIFGGAGDRAVQAWGYNSHTNSRADKAIAYDTPKFGGFSLGVQTTSNPANLNEYTVVRALYQNGPLDLQASYEWNTDVTKRKDYAIGASYDFKVAKAMVLHGKEENFKSSTSVGVTVPFGAVLFKAQYRSERYGSNASPRNIAVGVDYALSKRTVLFADAADTKNAAQTAYRIGVRHSF